MALTSTLGSPGIEIREVDNSFRLDSSTATTVFVPGFASQGPVDEVMSIGSMSDFETIYGVPTNAAERYFYYTVKAILDGSGNGVTVLCSRLPYGSGKGDIISNAYTMLAYPAIPVIKKKNPIKYTCLTSETISIKQSDGKYKDTDCFVASFTFADNNSTTVKYYCPKDDADIQEKWVFYTEKNGSLKVADYSFTILDDNKGYSVSLTETNTEIEPVSIYNETSTYDFDKFVFSEHEISKLVKQFAVKKPNDTTAEPLTPEVEEIILTVDDDKFTSSTIEMTKIEGYKTEPKKDGDGKIMTDSNGKVIYNISYTKTVPEGTATLYNKDGSFNTDLNAPEIYFGESVQARGLIASEDKDSSCYVHLSYTLEKPVPGETPIKCGSLYIKLKYSNTEIDGWNFIPEENCSIKGELVEAFEIAASYQGQSQEQLAQGNDVISDFSDEVTYIVGSPVTYHISLADYYKVITGETVKWSRRPYVFSDETGENIIKENTDDAIGTEGTFGNFDAIGHSAFIVINTSRTIINNNFEGFYLGLTDNMFVNPSDDYTFNAIENVKITTDFYDKDDDGKIGLIDKADDSGKFQTLSTNRLSFYLDSNSQGSISRVLTRNITTMDISGTDYDDTINMGLFKLTKSTDSSDVLKLNYSLREKYNWSFGKTRLKSIAGSTRPVSYFVENIVEDSSNLTVIMNPFIAKKSFVDTDGVIHGKMRILGSKLLNNLEWFESKYLLRNYTSISDNTKYSNKNISAIVPAMLAKSSIESWKSMVKQAGVTPRFIKANFKNATDTQITNDSDNLYNFHPLNSLIPFGTYTATGNENKFIGELPAKLERALELVENDEQYPDIDIVLEAGLGTVYMYSKTESVVSESAGAGVFLDEKTGDTSIFGEEDGDREAVFDENIILQGVEDLRTGRTSLSDDAQDAIENYRAIQTVFTNFANSMQNGGRGDTFYISDIPRGVLIKGKNTKVTDLYGSIIENNAYDFGETVNHSFPTSVYYPIKHTFDTIVSSYMSTYAQWVKILDAFSSEKVWIPVSGYITANMAATDGTYGPWYAAAGLRRGVINGVLDYALSPSVTQRTDLYKICINSVPKIPNYGVTIWGIRTMSKKDSAFDQNTCRRTFLYMEKKVKQTLRYYIFEPNTSYTRLQIYNDIYPFLEKIKNNGGIYSYTLVCDTTNNTPDVINNGDLAVSIGAAPTRTAENIVVEFTANKYTEEVSASESIS